MNFFSLRPSKISQKFSSKNAWSKPLKKPSRGAYIINRFFFTFSALKTASPQSPKKPSRGAYIINIFFFHFFDLKNRLYSRRKKLLHLCYHRFARWSNYRLYHSSPEICLDSETMIQFLMQNTSQRCKVQWTSINFPSDKKSCSTRVQLFWPDFFTTQGTTTSHLKIGKTHSMSYPT